MSNNNNDELEKLFNTMMQLGKPMAQCTQESQEERAATMLQFSALTTIKEKKKITLTELADTIKLSKSSATQLVERLVGAGMVLRNIDPNDKRSIHLALTSSGTDELSRLKKKFISTLKDAFADIPKNDILELIRIHSAMINSLNQRKNEQN